VARGPHPPRLRPAIDHGALLGTFLADPLDVPGEVVDYLSQQLEVADPSCGKRYTRRAKTRLEHTWEIRERHHLREFAEAEADLEAWADARAWTTGDGPKVIFNDAVEWGRPARSAARRESVGARQGASAHCAGVAGRRQRPAGRPRHCPGRGLPAGTGRARGRGSDVTVDRDGRLHVASLKAVPEPQSLLDLRKAVQAMLPRADLPEVVLEVMAWERGFIEAFTASSGGAVRMAVLDISVAARLSAQAMNVGYQPVARRGVSALARDLGPPRQVG
jgi:hypothetical protein